MLSILQCMDCGQQYPIDRIIYNCDFCGGLLDVLHDPEYLRKTISTELFDNRLGTQLAPYNSGVWRYKEMIYPDIASNLVVSKSEGNTNLYAAPKLANSIGVKELFLKHEGENPTGSFKDRGMTSGITQAQQLGITRVACASTGNTSASLASYAAYADMEGIVFFQNKQIATGKLAQAIAYGATCVQIDADFDRNLELVREIANVLQIYVLNSVNPFRLEGQKSIIIETLHQLRWEAPDWIVFPGGNLGNSAAFGKALHELCEIGIIDRVPRIAIIQAEGANPLFRSYQDKFRSMYPIHAETIATAIKIGNPVNFKKAVRTLNWTNGIVEQVSDQEIMDAKAIIDQNGIGCEPASACSLAGIQKLVQTGIIKSNDRVVGVLTGHVLKDTDAIINYHQGTLKNISPTYRNNLLQSEANIKSLSDILKARPKND